MSEQQHPVNPTTTAEEDLKTAGQRKVNMVWETTQAFIAIAVVIAALAFNFVPASKTSSEMLSDAFFVVIGFYFGRTNHARIGDKLDTR